MTSLIHESRVNAYFVVGAVLMWSVN